MGGVIVGTHQGTVYDSVVSANSSITMAASLDSTSTEGSNDVDSVDPYLVTSVAMWGGNDVLSMEGADVYFSYLDDDTVHEVTITGQNFDSVQNSFDPEPRRSSGAR